MQKTRWYQSKEFFNIQISQVNHLLWLKTAGRQETGQKLDQYVSKICRFDIARIKDTKNM